MKAILLFTLLLSASLFALGANAKPTIKPEDAAKLEARISKLLPKADSQANFFVYGHLITLQAEEKSAEYVLRFVESRYAISKNEKNGWNIVSQVGRKADATADDVRYILQVLAIGAREEKAPRREFTGFNGLDHWLTRRYPTSGLGFRLRAEPKGIRIPL